MNVCTSSCFFLIEVRTAVRFILSWFVLFCVLSIFNPGNILSIFPIYCTVTGVFATAAGGVHGRERWWSQVVFK